MDNMKELRCGIFQSESHDNIYVIGDVHGDYACFVHCFVDLCKSCDVVAVEKVKTGDVELDKWNYKEILNWKPNNKTIVILCGDLIDRKRFDHVLDDECSDMYILETVLRLKTEAMQNGGNIIIVSGNHEMMNITNPEYDLYISPANKKMNYLKMTDSLFVNKYIQNSYAWIVVNDILICHGGLCSDYLNYLNEIHPDIVGLNIVEYINNAYRKFFNNYNYKASHYNEEYYNLFVAQTEEKKQNVFWCRMWGYNSHTLELFTKTLDKVHCKKMIVAHCPQFLDKLEPKMINFEYKNNTTGYNLARIDLGMSRSFDYNLEDKFLYYLEYNFNRKMSILKLHNKHGHLSFDVESIITVKLSCIQYLLIKYGVSKQDWKKAGVNSNWLGFEKIETLINAENLKKCIAEPENRNTENIFMCLLYPVFCTNLNKLQSIQQFKNIMKNNPKTLKYNLVENIVSKLT